MNRRLAKWWQKHMWVRIAIPILASVAFFSASIFLVNLPNAYDSLLRQKKANLENMSQIVMGVIKFYYDKQQRGILTQGKAQKEALENIALIRFGPESKNYFWVNDLYPRMVMHPYVTDLVGKDISDLKDPLGNKLFVEMVRATKKTGSAFVSYQWQWKEKADQIHDKISYVKRFKPWGWIVGSGVYLNDIEMQAKRQAKHMLVSGLVVLALVIMLSAFSIWQGIVAAKKIRESEATLRGIFEQTAEYMCILSLEGEMRSVNKTALNLSGNTLEDVLGRPFWEMDWWREQRQEVRDLVKKSVVKAQNGIASRIEAGFSSHQGGKIVLDVNIQPIRNDSGAPVFIFVDGVDVTERKRSQEELEAMVKERTLELEQALEKLKATQNHLVQAEKMASLGSLVAGVAHEINTPLGLGVTNASYLLEQVDKIKKTYEGGEFTRGEFEKFLKRTEEVGRSLDINLRRGASIIRSFKQVAVDQEVEERRNFAVKGYLDEVLISLKPRYKHTGHTVLVDCPDDIKLDTYPGLLMQVLSNLIINSLIHGLEGVERGTINISASQRDDLVVFEYTDDGIGMTPEQKAKVYDPFFTTKQGKGGTGLGMHIVYNIVTQKLCGDISLETAPGKGVRYVLTLPAKHPGGACDISEVTTVG